MTFVNSVGDPLGLSGLWSAFAAELPRKFSRCRSARWRAGRGCAWKRRDAYIASPWRDCQFQQAIRRGSTVGLSAEGTSLKSTRAALSILLVPLEIFAVKVRGFREPRVL